MIDSVTEHDAILTDFRFRGGEVVEELSIHYATFGKRDGPPVLLLHGSNGNHKAMLTEAFMETLFASGGPLDARKYFLIAPDAIGAGQSSKPSDGRRAAFPRYTLDDMVSAQQRLLREHLGLDRLHLVFGNSMGGMLAWLWAIDHGDILDAAVAMACQPLPMSGRNWLMRRMLIDSIRKDPSWHGGDYTEPPAWFRFADVFFDLLTSGGEHALRDRAPSRVAADAIVDELWETSAPKDANDTLYQWDASRDFDPSAELSDITTPMLLINSEDDERNPPNLTVLADALRQVAGLHYHLIAAGVGTSGHATTARRPDLYEGALRDFLRVL